MGWETIIGLSSMLIALCALAFSILQGKYAQKHNRISITPHLTTFVHSDVQNNKYSADLINGGIGPALIQSYEILVDNKLVEGHRDEKVLNTIKLLFPNYNYCVYKTWLEFGYAMAEKERLKLIEIIFKGANMPTPEEVAEAIDRVIIKIKYKSLYGDSFELMTDGMSTVKNQKSRMIKVG